MVYHILLASGLVSSLMSISLAITNPVISINAGLTATEDCDPVNDPESCPQVYSDNES